MTIVPVRSELLAAMPMHSCLRLFEQSVLALDDITGNIAQLQRCWFRQQVSA